MTVPLMSTEMADAIYAEMVATPPGFDVGGWRERAACREMGPARFYPEDGDDQGEADAKAVCAGCPVIADCRAYGIRAEHDPRGGGILGGLNARERYRIYRVRNRPAEVAVLPSNRGRKDMARIPVGKRPSRATGDGNHGRKWL